MSQPFFTYHCHNCNKYMGTALLDRLANQANPCCPRCQKRLNPKQLRYAADIKHNQLKGPLLLPTMALSVVASIALLNAVSQLHTGFVPILMLISLAVTICCGINYREKGGSVAVCILVGIMFGPLAALFLATVGPWRSTARSY